jgi:hypothetical protein
MFQSLRHCSYSSGPAKKDASSRIGLLVEPTWTKIGP